MFTLHGLTGLPYHIIFFLSEPDFLKNAYHHHKSRSTIKVLIFVWNASFVQLETLKTIMFILFKISFAAHAEDQVSIPIQKSIVVVAITPPPLPTISVFFLFFFLFSPKQNFQDGGVLPRMPIKARHSYIEISDIIMIVIKYII